MTSNRLQLSDDELLRKIGAAAGDVMIAIAQRRDDDRWSVVLVDRANGNIMALSIHDDHSDAEQDGWELDRRLDRLAETRPGLRIRPMSEPSE